jgi:hypothetical protein
LRQVPADRENRTFDDPVRPVDEGGVVRTDESGRPGRPAAAFLAARAAPKGRHELAAHQGKRRPRATPGTPGGEAARQTAAALAAGRGPQATRTARALARAATVDPTRPSGSAAAATVVLLARTGRSGPATTDLGRELDRSVELIRAHHSAVGNHTEAASIAAGPAVAITAPVRVAGRIRAAARAAERVVDHGR